MEKKISNDLDLGRLLGRREAFSVMAARCSAADATHLRQIREQKNYLECKDWGEFCGKYLHISKDTANRAIRLLEDFGPQYFELAQLTRISAETYRAIAPAIQDGKLHTEGEAIELIPENAEKVAAAVAVLRKKEPKAPAKVTDPIIAAADRASELYEEFSGLSRRAEDRYRLSSIIQSLRFKLERLQRTL